MVTAGLSYLIAENGNEPALVKDFYIAGNSPTHDNAFPTGGGARHMHPEKNMEGTFITTNYSKKVTNINFFCLFDACAFLV